MADTPQLIELTFSVEHADMYRNAEGELIVHAIGVDVDDLLTNILAFKQEQKAKAAVEQAKPEQE